MYEQHKCTNPNCQNQTTNRVYCGNSCRAKHCLIGKSRQFPENYIPIDKAQQADKAC